MTNKLLNRVSQKAWETADCGIACVAMVTDVEYNESFEILKHNEKKGQFFTRHKHLINAITALNKHAVKKKFISYENINSLAIIAVNEDANRNWHWIAFDGARRYAYDPNPEVTHKINLKDLKENYIPRKGFYIEVIGI